MKKQSSSKNTKGGSEQFVTKSKTKSKEKLSYQKENKENLAIRFLNIPKLKLSEVNIVPQMNVEHAHKPSDGTVGNFNPLNTTRDGEKATIISNASPSMRNFR